MYPCQWSEHLSFDLFFVLIEFLSTQMHRLLLKWCRKWRIQYPQLLFVWFEAMSCC